MKANRKTMLGVAFAVAVIALAGIGYAVGYTAYTSTTNNKEVPEYVVIKLDDDNNSETAAASAVYTGQTIKIEYNTKTDSTGTKYQMKEESMTFTIYIDASAVNATVDNYSLGITGLTQPTIAGATAVWSTSAGPVVAPATTATITGNIAAIDAAYLTLTITRDTSVDAQGWTSTQPAAQVTLGGTIEFTLTNIAAA